MNLPRVPLRWQMRITAVILATVVGLLIAECSTADAAVRPAWFPWPTVTCAEDPRLQDGRYAGVFNTRTRLVVIWPTHCRQLAHLQSNAQTLSPTKSPNRAAFALFVVAHELAHAGGVADERAADCHGLRIYHGVGRKLRVAGWKVRALVWRLPHVVPGLSECAR